MLTFEGIQIQGAKAIVEKLQVFLISLQRIMEPSELSSSTSPFRSRKCNTKLQL